MSKPPPHPGRPARILVTVLDRPIRAMIAEILRLEEYDVVETASADEALRVAQESPEGLIIMTYERDPHWPGNETLAVFSTARPPGDGHVVILLSADRNILADRQTFRADDVLLLPFTVEHLIETTARAQRLFRTKRNGTHVH